jgi:hypothetical protein
MNRGDVVEVDWQYTDMSGSKVHMNAITAKVQNGRLDLETPPDWPEGCPVIIEPLTDRAEKIGLDESEWRNDSASLADWDDWIKTIEPLELTPDEVASLTMTCPASLG